MSYIHCIYASMHIHYNVYIIISFSFFLTVFIFFQSLTMPQNNSCNIFVIMKSPLILMSY